MGLLDLFRSKPQPAPQQPQQPPAVLTEQLQRYDQAFRQLTESNEFPNLFASLYDRYYSNGTWWIPAGGIPMLGGTSNKYQGRDAYISIHEQDNRLIVDACRLLYAREPVAKSIVNYLQCFVLGSGLTYKLCSKKEDAIDESILEAGQEYIDEWCERNEQTEREHECFECSIVDGEFFLWMKVYNGEVVVRRIEPEFIRNPPNMAMEQGWFFGVKYDPQDMETPLAYWYEPPMSKGQEIPADEIIHYKANVTKNVARGVSDFFPVLDDLNGIAGLIDNIRAGATARAEIAYMYSIANATQGAISDFASARRDRTAQNPITNRTDSFKGMSAGKVVYHGQNASFQTMPQGDVQSYIEAAQQSLRLIGNRWCMPEYMVSADASNNNYASSLIAGGPFVRKIEYVQKRYGTSMKRLMEAVVNQAIAGKVIPARYLPMLKVEVTAHSPVIEDKYQQAQTYDIYTRMGAMSVESVASKIGEDYEKVQAENEEHADRMLDQQVAQNDALGGGDQQNSGSSGFAESLQENTLDDYGHMHKGNGPGGGQFTSKDSGSNDGKFADKGGNGGGLDHGMLNVPLDKRGGGSIDSQIDKWKKDQAAKQKEKQSSDAQKRRENKRKARELYDLHADTLADSTSAKSGKSKKEVLAFLDSMVKWEPEKAITILTRHAEEKASKGQTNPDSNSNDGKFADKGEEGEKGQKKGSTGEVQIKDGKVYKNSTRNEAKVYAALKGVDGVANGEEKDGKIVTDFYKNIVSVDEIPRDKRKSYASIVDKAYGKIVNALTALSDAGYNYNDPLQVGFNDKKKPHLFDFSMSEKMTREEAIDDNLQRLSHYLAEFGNDRKAKAVTQVNQVYRSMNDIDNVFMQDEPENKDARDILRNLKDEKPKYLYYTTNGRTIPNVAQSEQRDSIKVIASIEPLTNDFMSQWEILPVVHRNK